MRIENFRTMARIAIISGSAVLLAAGLPSVGVQSGPAIAAELRDEDAASEKDASEDKSKGSSADEDKDSEQGDKEKKEPIEVLFADETLKLMAPGSWEKRKPKTNIVEHEFAIPRSEGDDADGRWTLMAAGGGVQGNIDRWIGQFSQPDGSSTTEKAKTDKQSIAGHEVHLVDISGTYDDRPPFGGKGVKRENYRMLGAVIVTEKRGTHFIKLIGPAHTVTDHEEEFKEMIAGLSNQ